MSGASICSRLFQDGSALRKGAITEEKIIYHSQAEHLKRELLTKIAETKASCEATIETKAQQLTSALEAADRCPCSAASAKW